MSNNKKEEQLITNQREADISRMIRLEVLTDQTQKSVGEIKQLMTESIASNVVRFDSFEKKLDDTRNQNDSRYVRRDEFGLIRSIVYGFVGLIVISVIGAIISMVVRRS